MKTNINRKLKTFKIFTVSQTAIVKNCVDELDAMHKLSKVLDYKHEDVWKIEEVK